MRELNLILLHDGMLNKEGRPITSSLTLIDVHDLARSCCTYGVKTTYIAHPSSALRKLARTLKTHWEDGFGATYNPNRKEALSAVDIVQDLDEALHKIDLRSGRLPKIVATSARDGGTRIGYSALRQLMDSSNESWLIMLGTGWGMDEALLKRADYFLEPINGTGDYNHLSVRSAGAITLDRLFGR